VSAAVAGAEGDRLAALEGRFAACLTHDSGGRLGEIRVPTLVLAAEADLVYPPAETRALAAAIPGARYELIPGAHLPSGRALRAFDEAVLAFLDG
jgi:pimeloyl-ACP methyl ester carboxylesterase